MVFMDIDMPGLSGMETAALLRERNCNTTLIFVSSYEHFVFESIRYMPFRFIRKSLYQEEVPEALQSWFAIQSNQKQSITLRTGTGNANTYFHVLYANQICRISFQLLHICILLFLFFLDCTAFRNYIPFCFLDQRLEFVIRRKLAKLDIGINMCSMIFALIGVEPWDNLNGTRPGFFAVAVH